MKEFLHTFNDEVSEGVHLHGVQVWRPSVPEPLYVGFGLKKAQCDCGQVFKNRQAFIEHYIYWAVWQDESGYIPKLLRQAPGHNLLTDSPEANSRTSEAQSGAGEKGRL